MSFTLIAPNPTDVWRGDGAVLYKDKDLVGETIVGALDGETKFGVDIETKDINYNGAFGKTKDLIYKSKIQPKLDIKLCTLNYTSMAQVYAGLTITDEGAYHKVAINTSIVAGDYWDNLCFAGVRADGKYFKIYMTDVIGVDKIESAFKSEANVVNDVTLYACYDRATPTTVPCEIWLED
jgi:hypothetical protein